MSKQQVSECAEGRRSRSNGSRCQGGGMWHDTSRTRATSPSTQQPRKAKRKQSEDVGDMLNDSVDGDSANNKKQARVDRRPRSSTGAPGGGGRAVAGDGSAQAQRKHEFVVHIGHLQPSDGGKKSVCGVTGSSSGAAPRLSVSTNSSSGTSSGGTTGSPSLQPARSPSKISRSQTELKICCELNDEWQDQWQIAGGGGGGGGGSGQGGGAGGGGGKVRARPTTGDSFTDKMLKHLEHQGFDMLHTLAMGRFGVVMAAQSHIHRRLTAVKFLTRNVTRRLCKIGGPENPWNVPNTPLEVVIHKDLVHPNIVQVLDYHCINGRLCLVLEMCEAGDLDRLLNQRPSRLLPEPVCRRYYINILDGLDYLHGRGIAHRDVACSNVLVDRHNRAKLADFGDACVFLSAGLQLTFTGACGSLGFQAPEVLEMKEYEPRQVDLWQSGVVLFAMLTGTLPFGASTNTVDMLTRMRARLDLVFYSSYLTPEAQTLLRGVLSYSPKDRFTMKRARQCDWLMASTTSACQDQVAIGNYYLVRNPRKTASSANEEMLKNELGI